MEDNIESVTIEVAPVVVTVEEEVIEEDHSRERVFETLGDGILIICQIILYYDTLVLN